MLTNVFINNLEVAIVHADAGIPVFPVDVHYDAAKDKWEKIPHITDYPNNATTDPNQIKRWWETYPDALPGIGLGQADLVLLDPDRHGAADGVAAWEALAAVHGLPVGPVMITAGGGLHLYFKQPEGEKLGNSSGGLPEGIDVRGARGFVIAPGSIRPDGERWQPQEGSPLLTDSYHDVPVIPPWLVALIREPFVATPAYDPVNPPPSGGREKAWAAAALAGMVKDLAAMGRNSGRNNKLTALAYRSGRLVINGWIDQAAVAEGLIQASRANGLVAEDGLRKIQDCIDRGMRAGCRKPHPPLPETPKFAPPPLEEVKASLAGLVGRAKLDPGAPYTDEALALLVDLQERDLAAFIVLRADLKAKAGMVLKVFDAAVAKKAKAMMVQARKSAHAALPTKPEAIDQIMERLNAKYAHVAVGKDYVIADNSRPVVLRSTAAMGSKFSNKFTRYLDDDGAGTLNDFETWMKDPRRLEYDAAVFNPSGVVRPHEFNLWQGFELEPRQGDWSLLRDHIFTILCRKNGEHFRWLMAWLAQMLREPHKKPGSTVVLRGGKGAGKSLLADCLIKIIGHHALSVSKSTHIFGKFNAVLGRCLFISLEEAFWAGDKVEAEGVLKDLITNMKMILEPKNIDSYFVDNHLHLMVITNKKWAVPATVDERRFFVLEVDDSKANDENYFKPIIDQMENGGYEAMLHDLLHHDYGAVNLRYPPHTTALNEQKLYSLDQPQQWLMNVLYEGQFSSDQYLENVRWNGSEPLGIERQKVYDSYTRFMRTQRYGNTVSIAVLGKILHEIIPNLKDTDNHPRKYIFPSLADCCVEFAVKTGVTVEMPSQSMNGESVRENNTIFAF